MNLRAYQIPIFNDNTTGILGLHWARQLGKSTVLAAWAVDRLLTRPSRLVTVLSNCQQNGAEFAEKCQATCAEHGAAFESESRSVELDLLATERSINVAAEKTERFLQGASIYGHVAAMQLGLCVIWLL